MNKDVYKRHFLHSSNHWWFKARREIIYEFLKKKIKKNIHILDFGCGSGTNLQIISKFGKVHFFDSNLRISNLVKKKFNTNDFIQIKRLSKNKKKFDLILALDVIEHIENDRLIIKKLYKKLNKNGKILITVPAFNFLFSSKDRDLHHKRRYTLNSLTKVLDNFFIIKKKTYFNFLLSLPIIISIIFYKIFNVKFIDKVEKKPSKILNFILFKIFSAEKYFLNNINLPFGISILMYAKKKD